MTETQKRKDSLEEELKGLHIELNSIYGIIHDRGAYSNGEMRKIDSIYTKTLLIKNEIRSLDREIKIDQILS